MTYNPTTSTHKHVRTMKNMKNIFSMTLLLAAAIVFTACQGEEADLFDKSAAERLNAVADAYTAVLAEPESGWVMEYYPTNSNSNPTGLGYLMLVNFQEDGFVRVAMQNYMNDYVYEEDLSVWEVITDNGPVLSFSTYNNLLHSFSDPAIYDQGNGLSGDYEFVMVDVPEDHQTIMLKGKKRGTYVRLTRLPDGTDFKTYLQDVRDFETRIFSASAPNLDYLTLDGKVYTFDEPSTTLPNIYLKGYDPIANEYRLPFIIGKKGDNYFLRFRTTLKFEEEGNEDIKGEQEFIYNADADKFFGVDNAENVIQGAVPAEFFTQTLHSATNYVWKFDKNSAKSESMQTLFDNAYNAFQTIAYTMESASFARIVASNQASTFLRVTCSYTEVVNRRPVKKTTNYQYLIDVADEGDFITVSYAGADDASTQVLSAFPAVDTFVKTLVQQKYQVEARDTRFNISAVKLTGENPELWFNVML